MKLTPTERALAWGFSLMWAFFAAWFIYLGIESGRPALCFLALLVPLPLVFLWVWILFLPIAIHEFGHFLAGKIMGLRLRHLVLGPFIWEKEDGKWRYHFVRSSLGGLTVMDPPPPGLWSRGATLAFVSGGPAATLLCLVACLIAIFGYGRGDASVQFWVGVFAVMNGLTLFLNLFCETSAHGQPSDGSYLLGLISISSDFYRAQQVLSRTAGIRPRVWDPWAVDVAVKDSKLPVHILFSNRMGYHFYFDREDYREAEACLERAMEHRSVELPDDFQWVKADICLEGAYFLSVRHKDGIRSSGLIDLARQYKVPEPCTARRAVIASMLARGEREKGARFLAIAFSKLDLDTMPGQVEQDWLTRLADVYGIPVPKACPNGAA